MNPCDTPARAFWRGFLTGLGAPTPLACPRQHSLPPKPPPVFLGADMATRAQALKAQHDALQRVFDEFVLRPR